MEFPDGQLARSDTPSPRQDTICLVLLIVMAAALLPGLNPGDPDRRLCDILGQMTSYWLLPAMGFLLALRTGVVDLSVWMSFSAGSLVAAWMIAAGRPPIAAMPAGILVGAALGAVNALLVRGSRLPSAAVTFITAVGVFLLLRWAAPARTVLTPDQAWDNWHILGIPNAEGASIRPLFMTRMLAVILLYTVTMLTMLLAGLPRGRGLNRWGDRRKRGLSLIACGALAAAGGVLWLLDNTGASVPSFPIGDLRVPLAAVLAGGLLLQGPLRTLLAGVCLPPAMLLATAWRQTGWYPEFYGCSLQLPLLLTGAILMALGGRATGTKAKNWFIAGAVMAGGAVALLCVSTNVQSQPALTALRWTSVGLMALSAAVYCLGKTRTLAAEKS